MARVGIDVWPLFVGLCASGPSAVILTCRISPGAICYSCVLRLRGGFLGPLLITPFQVIISPLNTPNSYVMTDMSVGLSWRVLPPRVEEENRLANPDWLIQNFTRMVHGAGS